MYLAGHPASASVETLVHLEIDTLDNLTSPYQSLEVELPDSVSVVQATVPPNWLSGYLITQPIGDGWLVSGASLLLEVPSALVPFSSNYLLNPEHPEAVLAKTKSASQFPFDPRLVKSARAPVRE